MGKEQLIHLTKADASANPVGVRESTPAEQTLGDPGHAEQTLAEQIHHGSSYSQLRDSMRAQGSPSRPEMPWRTLDELAGSPDFEKVVADEFPRYAPSEWEDGPSRRSFLQLAGASVGLAGLTACTRQPRERIVPYIEQPENVVPGKPTHYATAMTLGGIAQPLLAESNMGRPTKVTGNPHHPASSGAADLFAQASILGLYDPDRSRGLARGGRQTSVDVLIEQLRPTMQAQRALGGEGLRILTGAVSSPTIADQISRVKEQFPGSQWIQYESVNHDAALEASRSAFDAVLDCRYDLTQADVIVSLDSEFLSFGPAHLKIAADFAARRQVIRNDGGSSHGGGADASESDHGAAVDVAAVDGAATHAATTHAAGPINMNRLYALECVPGSTGAVADHRMGVTPRELGRFAVGLASRVGVGVSAPNPSDSKLEPWIEAIAADLKAHAGRCLVIPGQFTDPAVHVMAHALNAALGNVGTTVEYAEPALAEPAHNGEGLKRLVQDMEAGRVDVLVMLGVNPVFDAPGDLDFAAALEKVQTRIHAGLYEDETRALCQWHIPLAHYLEAWGDGRTYDGALSVQQPLIEPLYGGKTEAQILGFLLGENSDSYDLARATWSKRAGGADFDTTWRKALYEGYLADSALPAVAATLAPGAVADAATSLSAAAAVDGLTLVVRPDPSLYDGRFANNGWLQEVPKTITKVCWDQVALVAPATMERLGIEPNSKTQSVVTITVGGASVDAPILLSPGQAENTVAIALGHGRTRAGSVGNRDDSDNGVNVAKLLTSDSRYHLDGAQIEDTGRQYKVAATQEHFQIDIQSQQAEGRHLVKRGTVAEYQENPHFTEHIGAHVPQNVSLFPDWEYPTYAWGMAINLNSCTGCNACIVACQAENNIPVVGRDQVIKGREMHWLRIDRYYEGDPDSPRIHHQPVACMHCERAPCELVCPVGATTHSDEGLNDMAYNRCIGTRYCSNNCPYKVRRFNFLKYNDTKTPVLKLARNPDVSVRTRGVMEKCTYCTQRISRARIQAQVEGRKIREGEITTACQETCPTNAIVFGDINDPNSEVSRWKQSGLNYHLLDELATVPRTTYLAKLTNPNPALAAHDSHGGDTVAPGH